MGELDDRKFPMTVGIAGLHLDRYRFRDSAKVVLCAFRKASATYMRWSLGTVGKQRQLPHEFELTDFGDRPDRIRFRVWVTDVDDRAGQLLGSTAALDADWASGEKESLLPARCEQLGHEVFRVLVPDDEDDDDGPWLVVNEELDNWRVEAQSDAFVAMAYASAVRQVLHGLLRGGVLAENDDDWKLEWIEWARREMDAPAVPWNEGQTALVNWVDGVARSFSRKFGALAKYRTWQNGGQ